MTERCDRCGGRGFATWTKGEHSLTLCLQHNDKHELQILAQGFEPSLIVDEVMGEKPEPVPANATKEN